MSSHLTPEEAIALVPEWGDVDLVVEKAYEGLTNRSFRLRAGNDLFVLRLDAAHTSVLAPDRAAERVALERAATAGIGPEVVFADDEQGVLVTRFIPGKALTADDLQDASMLERIAIMLRRVHGLPALGNGFDLAVAAKRYLTTLADRPDMQGVGERCVRLVEASRSGGPTCFCHNDVIAPNIIDSGSLFLIDWEYAGDNDAYFDLAALIAYHQLEPDYAEALLNAYAGCASAVDSDRLEAQLRGYDALHWLWLASREVVSPSAAQREQLERLQGRLSSS